MSNSGAANNHDQQQQGRYLGIPIQGNVSPITPPPAYAALPPGPPGGSLAAAPVHYEPLHNPGHQFVPHYGHGQHGNMHHQHGQHNHHHHHTQYYPHPHGHGHGHHHGHSQMPIPIQFTAHVPPFFPHSMYMPGMPTGPTPLVAGTMPLLPYGYGYDVNGAADRRALRRFVGTLCIAILAYIGVGVMVGVGIVGE